MNPTSLQITDEADKLPDRSPQAVELPDNERITGPKVGLCIQEAGPLATPTTRLVGEEAIASRALKGVDL